MRRLARTSLSAVAALLASATAAHAQYTVYALRDLGVGAGQQLISFNSSSPNAVTVIGGTGASLTGIDFRPANNLLYGYDGTTVYTVSTSTGLATSLFTPTTPAAQNGGFDFNPVPDRLRVIGVNNVNLRLNVNAPFTAANTINDAPYSFASGASPIFTGVAYTNNDNDPATGTTLYGIDASGGVNSLVVITTPNGGPGSVASPVGGVGNLGLAAGSFVTGFDIVTVGTSNFGFLSVFPPNAGIPGFTNLYTVNLATGATSLVGAIGTTGGIADIAIAAVPEPGTWMLLATGLAGLGAVARRRRDNA